jgi:hypothetical protein
VRAATVSRSRSGGSATAACSNASLLSSSSRADNTSLAISGSAAARVLRLDEAFPSAMHANLDRADRCADRLRNLLVGQPVCSHQQRGPIGFGQALDGLRC